MWTLSCETIPTIPEDKNTNISIPPEGGRIDNVITRFSKLLRVWNKDSQERSQEVKMYFLLCPNY